MTVSKEFIPFKRGVVNFFAVRLIFVDTSVDTSRLMIRNLLFLSQMGIMGHLSLRREKVLYAEKRSRQRVKCSAEAEFADKSQRTCSCKIVDISESGVGIAISTNIVVGNIVNIKRPAIEAEVVWAVDDKAGLRIIR